QTLLSIRHHAACPRCRRRCRLLWLSCRTPLRVCGEGAPRGRTYSDDPSNFRRSGSGRARAAANALSLASARRQMWELAEEYERLAQEAERAGRRQPRRIELGRSTPSLPADHAPIWGARSHARARAVQRLRAPEAGERHRTPLPTLARFKQIDIWVTQRQMISNCSLPLADSIPS